MQHLHKHIKIMFMYICIKQLTVKFRIAIISRKVAFYPVQFTRFINQKIHACMCLQL